MSDEAMFTSQELRDLGLPTYAELNAKLRKIEEIVSSPWPDGSYEVMSNLQKILRGPR